jgi:hypothetical protein
MKKGILVSIAVVLGGLLLGAGVGLATLAGGETPPQKGTWSLNNWTGGGDSLSLELKRRTVISNWVWGSSQPIADLHGLTREQLHAAHATVRFTIDRDAGTLTFDGTVTLGVGRGEFGFAPNPTYLAKLGALGYEDVAEADVFGMAMRDVSLAYAEEVKRSGVQHVTLEDLCRFQDHGIELEFIRELVAAGATGLTGDDLVRLRDHGVDGAFVRALASAGYPDMSVGDIVRLHDHGVDGEFVAGLAGTGYKRLAAEEIIRLHDHGVDPEYVARVQASGYENLTVDQIIKLHEHGVD